MRWAQRTLQVGLAVIVALSGCLDLGGSWNASGTTGPAVDTYGCFRDGAHGHAAVLATDTDAGADTTTTTDGDPEVLTTGTTAPEDYEAMDACAIALACEEVWHQTGEFWSHDADGYLPEELCLLRALRDGRPGAYRSEHNVVWANGGRTEAHILHVGIDRQVTIVHHHRESGYYAEFSEYVDEYSSARSCQLRDAGFFSGCLENYDSFEHVYHCLNPEKWLRGCFDAEPWCPCAPEGT